MRDIGGQWRSGELRAARGVAGLEALEDRRLFAAADLDPTFGAGGTVRTDFYASTYNFNETGYAVAVAPDGKIVAAGAGPVSGRGFVVARYTSGGALDTSFGGDGR